MKKQKVLKVNSRKHKHKKKQSISSHDKLLKYFQDYLDNYPPTSFENLNNIIKKFDSGVQRYAHSINPTKSYFSKYKNLDKEKYSRAHKERMLVKKEIREEIWDIAKKKYPQLFPQILLKNTIKSS